MRSTTIATINSAASGGIDGLHSILMT